MIERSKFNLSDHSVRPYELSVWTLNDDFVTVLKAMDNDYLGTIQDGIVALTDDGTQELTFSIPMYIRDNGELIENPIWEKVYANSPLLNLHKIKVIFDKEVASSDNVFEFMVDTVTESHMDGVLTCEVKSTGLAFHELGKIGYKIVLSPDEFYTRYEAWFADSPAERLQDETQAQYDARVAEWEAREPIANLQYWNEELLGLSPLTEDVMTTNKWYYEIRMDWSGYDNTSYRDPHKLYEEPYVSDWTDSLRPKSVQKTQEKARLLESQNSNLYNLTQDLAKTFGVYCKYEYLYDDNFHIIGRKVVYYNNFISESAGVLNLAYPYSSSQISREIDSNDLITKLYVEGIEDSSIGMVTIADANVNPTKEDYILNFDYLYANKLISDEQYELIEPFETNMADINGAIARRNEVIEAYSNEKVEVEAKVTYYTNAKKLAEERLTAVNSEVANLDMVDGSADGIINNLAPRTGILIPIEGTTNEYTLRITEKGVAFETLRIYTQYNFSTQVLSGELTKSFPTLDEFGNLIGAKVFAGNLQKSTVYLTYSYSPSAYYDHLINTWSTRYATNSKLLADAEYTLTGVVAELEYQNTELQRAIAEKEQLKEDFARAMGSALREGYWVPDTYENYDARCKETMILPQLPSGSVSGANTYTKKLYWDGTLFDSEVDVAYSYGVNENTKFYPCIDLSTVLDRYKNYLDELSVIYYPFEASVSRPHSPLNAHYFTAGSTCSYATIAVRPTAGADKVLKPVMVVEGATGLSDEEVAFLRQNGVLGIVSYEDGQITISNTISIASLLLSDTVIRTANAVYPRFEIDSYYLSKDANNIFISYNNVPLTMYEDFYVLAREGKQYITIKPQALFRQSNLFYTIHLIYNVPTLNSAIYLDAVEVARENSQPKVSYTIQLNCLSMKLISEAYKLLSHIVSISDTELHFEKVFGYISKLTLNLDFPDQDTVEIKNYKNKFEDLFSSIVAQTAQMERTEYITNVARNAFTNEGLLKLDAVQETLDQSNLVFNFNSNRLTLNETEGLVGTSNDGKVAIRYDGIFTAHTKDANKDWVWESAIGPHGVRAEAITQGKLNISDIVIQSGDDIKFQLNKDGLYAFKSFKDDDDLIRAAYQQGGSALAHINDNIYQDTDHLQYVVHNARGIFLHARRGDLVYDENSDTHITELRTDIDRVELSWQGFIIRDWNANKIFWADTKGNLHLDGIIHARQGGDIGGWQIYPNLLFYGNINDNSSTNFVALQADPNSEYVFWAGARDPSSAPFAIKRNGQAVINAADIGQSSTIVIENSEFIGKVTTSEGWIGGDTVGLSIFSGGLGDGSIGWVKTSQATDIGFWAGSTETMSNSQRTLQNDANIKFKIFANGTSYISSSTITDSTINGSTIINIGSFGVAASGLCSIQDLSIVSDGTNHHTSISIGDVSSQSQLYFMVNSDGKLMASGGEIDYTDLSGVKVLRLGESLESCIDAASDYKIKTAFLVDEPTITTVKNILDTSASHQHDVLGLSSIEYGSYFTTMHTNVNLNATDNKIEWSSISRTGLSAANGSTNVYYGEYYNISYNNINFTNGLGISISAGTTATTNPNSFYLSTNSNGVTTVSLAGSVTAYTGKIGNFDFSSGDLYYSDDSFNSCMLGISSISYTNSNGIYFSVSSTNVNVPALTVNKPNANALTVSYTYNNSTYTVTLTSKEIAALKAMLTVVAASADTPCGYSVEPYITNLIANYING